MTEDELKELKEYEKKVEIINEEKEKHRKALETELKKLQGQIQVSYLQLQTGLILFSSPRKYVLHLMNSFPASLFRK